MPFLTRRGLVLAKIEVTYGTDPVPTAAANAILAADITVRVDGQLLTRNYLTSSLSRRAHVIGRKLVDVEFTTELKSAGAATAATPPEVGPLWRACGRAETIVATPGSESTKYTEISTGFESVTLYVYFDGIIHKVTGCYGDWEINAPAGEFGTIRWRFRGLYVAPVDGVIATGAVFQTSKPPIVASATFALGGYAAIAQALQIRGGIQIEERRDLNAVLGLKALQIVGRETGGSVNPEAVTEATHTFWANWSAGTEVALAAVIGSTQYDRVKLDAPKVQYGAPAWGDRGGNRIYDLPLHLNRSAEAGDDELTVTYD